MGDGWEARMAARAAARREATRRAHEAAERECRGQPPDLPAVECRECIEPFWDVDVWAWRRKCERGCDHEHHRGEIALAS